jgi:hypothetical protein
MVHYKSAQAAQGRNLVAGETAPDRARGGNA